MSQRLNLFSRSTIAAACDVRDRAEQFLLRVLDTDYMDSSAYWLRRAATEDPVRVATARPFTSLAPVYSGGMQGFPVTVEERAAAKEDLLRAVLSACAVFSRHPDLGEMALAVSRQMRRTALFLRGSFAEMVEARGESRSGMSPFADPPADVLLVRHLCGPVLDGLVPPVRLTPGEARLVEWLWPLAELMTEHLDGANFVVGPGSGFFATHAAKSVNGCLRVVAAHDLDYPPEGESFGPCADGWIPLATNLVTFTGLASTFMPIVARAGQAAGWSQ